MTGAEDGEHTGVASVGGSGYYDFKIGEPVFKLFDKRPSCVN